MQDLGRGFCFGCWTTKGGLQSVCGKCRVGACQKCRALWADKRKHGATTDEAGLMVNQSNICFCGGHLTPRGAAAYDRKVGCAPYAETFLFTCLCSHATSFSFFYLLICLSCMHLCIDVHSYSICCSFGFESCTRSPTPQSYSPTLLTHPTTHSLSHSLTH